jgi:predicted metal-binding membrane protein
MGEMTMPGGWTMSMMWMRMPGQTWASATASFLGMWIVMMSAMMLPSLVPALRRCRHAMIVGAGYFIVWTAVGIVVFPLGVAVAALAMEYPTVARTVPLGVGTVVLIAGCCQFTAWKARQLECCREIPECGDTLAPDARSAWRYGLHLGVRCGCCCANLMAILLAIGVMDLRAMAAVTAAISLERLTPAGERIARVTGAVIVATGLLLVARASP